MNETITESKVRKLLQTVDAGLCSGVGNPTPGDMCVEAAVCYALDLPHGDDPGCVGWAVRKFKIELNDREWSSSAARAAGMRKIAVAQLGSDQIDQNRFIELLIVKTIQKMCPLLFAELATLTKTDEDRESMESAGRACAAVMSLQEVVTVLGLAVARACDLDFDLARDRARFRTLGIKLAIARDLSSAIASALTLARNRAITSSRDLASDLARTRSHTLAIARSLTITRDLTRDPDLNLDCVLDLTLSLGLACDLDGTLTMFADICLEVLVEMESPGCQWLPLCEIKEVA